MRFPFCHPKGRTSKNTLKSTALPSSKSKEWRCSSPNPVWSSRDSPISLITKPKRSLSMLLLKKRQKSEAVKSSCRLSRRPPWGRMWLMPRGRRTIWLLRRWEVSSRKSRQKYRIDLDLTSNPYFSPKITDPFLALTIISQAPGSKPISPGQALRLLWKEQINRRN